MSARSALALLALPLVLGFGFLLVIAVLEAFRPRYSQRTRTLLVAMVGVAGEGVLTCFLVGVLVIAAGVLRIVLPIPGYSVFAMLVGVFGLALILWPSWVGPRILKAPDASSSTVFWAADRRPVVEAGLRAWGVFYVGWALAFGAYCLPGIWR